MQIHTVKNRDLELRKKTLKVSRLKLPNGKIFILRFRILDSYLDRQTKIKSTLFKIKFR